MAAADEDEEEPGTEAFWAEVGRAEEADDIITVAMTYRDGNQQRWRKQANNEQAKSEAGYIWSLRYAKGSQASRRGVVVKVEEKFGRNGGLEWKQKLGFS